MPSDVIPGDVRLFIIENIDSIAQLEGLLLLRSTPESSMSAGEVAQRLYTTDEEAREFLAALATSGFLKVENETYRYAPATPEQEQMVSTVAEVYARYLVPLTNLIHSKPKTKVQKFADAFKIRKD
jgi:hypothetical protein